MSKIFGPRKYFGKCLTKTACNYSGKAKIMLSRTLFESSNLSEADSMK